jgi:hypothetical protein
MVEPTENGNGLNATMRLRWARNRLLLSEPSVRVRLVVEAREFDDEKPQIPFTKDEDVIEKLAP